MIKVVSVNEKNGKVELTVEQLEQMLNEAYQAGKKENSISSPSPIGITPYPTWEYKNPRWDYGTDDKSTAGPNEHMSITYCNNATTTEGVAK